MRSKLVTWFDSGLAHVFLLRTILKSPGWMPSAYARVDVSGMGLLTFAEGARRPSVSEARPSPSQAGGSQSAPALPEDSLVWL